MAATAQLKACPHIPVWYSRTQCQTEAISPAQIQGSAQVSAKEDPLLSPVHTYVAATPLGAEFSGAKASRLAYSENWVTAASSPGRIPDLGSHTVTLEESLPARGGV